MASRNIYDVLHHVSTKLMDGRIVTQTVTLGEGLSHDEAEECKRQHECLNKFGFYDIAYVGRAWYDDKTTTVIMDQHVPVGLL